MILIIDNYDSFTYNLVQYIGEILQKEGRDPEAELKVIRNDELSLDQIKNLKPHKIVISPGPGTPSDAGVCVSLIEQLGAKIPLLGVCLGHQAIGQAFGGHIIRAPRIMHGKTSLMHHDGRGVFKNLPNPFVATRYHSLVIEKSTLPDCLEISSWTDEGEIMGVRHKKYALEGVQFHPESILTVEGMNLLKNFILC